MAQQQQQQRRPSGSNKGYRYGGKQMNGSSRSAYFATRKLWRAAKNKAARIAKNAKKMEEDRLKKERAGAKSGD